MTDEKPSSVEILLDGQEIAGLMIRPWTITQCGRLAGTFEQITEELKKRKLSYRDFFSVDEKGNVEVLNLDQLFFTLMPFVPEVLQITLGHDVDIDKIKQSDVMVIVAVIVRQNIDYLKNLFALIATLAKGLKSVTG